MSPEGQQHSSLPHLPGFEDVTTQELLPLWARAHHIMKFPDFYHDEAALDLYNRMGLSRFDECFKDVDEVIGLALRNRSRVFDDEVTKFATSYEKSHIIVVGGDLVTIHERLRDLDAQWYFVEQPQLNAIRRAFMPDAQLILDIDSYADYEWINFIPIEPGENVFVLFPSTLHFLDPLEVAQIMAALADKWPGVHVAFDAVTPKIQNYVGDMLLGSAFDYTDNFYYVEDIDEEVSTWTDEDLRFNVLRSYSMYDSISICPDWSESARKFVLSAMITRFYNLHHVYHLDPDFLTI